MVPFLNMGQIYFVDCAHDRYERFPFTDGEYHYEQRSLKIEPVLAKGFCFHLDFNDFLKIDGKMIAVVCSDRNPKAQYFAIGASETQASRCAWECLCELLPQGVFADGKL